MNFGKLNSTLGSVVPFAMFIVYLLEVRNTGLVDFDVTSKPSLLGHFGILMTDIMPKRKNVITLLHVAKY